MMTHFKNLQIRFKLLFGYTLIFMIATIGGGAAIYTLVKSTIETNIENELKNSTATILNMVKTAADTSIKNYLRAVAENNLEIVATLYNEFEEGLTTEEEAKAIAGKILLSQTIGKTGYIYCVNGDGIAPVHPRPGVSGNSFLDQWFVREQIRLKEGYLEYEWRNPGEKHPRPKALYMSYFEPWDWIISASSYRDEFKELVNVSDFRDSILTLSFGKTGYAYVLDSKGNLIVHPSLSGNYYNTQGRDGHYFVQDICRLKNGKLVYSWKNPGEEDFREKIVFFNYIPEYDWIVACSGYLGEVYAPLSTIKKIILFTVAMIMVLIFITSLWVNRSVVLPLRRLMNQLAMGTSGNLAVRMPVTSKDEIGQLAAYFNKFMETLEIYHGNLNAEIKEHQRSEEALRLSEEMFSKAFRCSPSGMFIASLKTARVLNVNESFLKSTGYSQEDVIGKDLIELNFFKNRSDGTHLMKKLIQEGQLQDQEIKFRKAGGEWRTGLLSAEIVDLLGESCILAAMRDLTQSRRLEREILNISERERQKIAMELHDDLCPQLIGIETMIVLLKKKLDEKEFDESSDAQKISDYLLDTIAKTRKMSRGLSPVNLMDHGFDLSFGELADYITDVFNVCCTYKFNGYQAIVDNNLATHIYYIAHEAVHNAARHAEAKNIFLELTIQDEKIRLSVSDDGKGIDNIKQSRGMGLKIMTYRADRVGANFEILKSSAGGVLVQLVADI